MIDENLDYEGDSEDVSHAGNKRSRGSNNSHVSGCGRGGKRRSGRGRGGRRGRGRGRGVSGGSGTPPQDEICWTVSSKLLTISYLLYIF